MPRFCEVALPIPLDRTFTYAVLAGAEPQRGARVIVPFRNEKMIGVVWGLHSKVPVDFEAKSIESVLDDEPLLSMQLLELAAWMARMDQLSVPEPEIAADQFLGLLRAGLFTRATLGLGGNPSDAEIDATVAVTVQTFLRAFGK